MNLVIQGARITPSIVRHLAVLLGTSDIDIIDIKAVRFGDVERDGVEARIADFCQSMELDFAWIPAGVRLGDFRLFVTDMAATLINIECIDELAGVAGVKDEVVAITAAAMRGEINFSESLNRRVALLKGLPEQALAKVHAKRLRLNPGAEALMAGLKAMGVRTALVSGGFTYFTHHLQRELGFDYAWANELEIVDGKLTGRVLGAIVDGQAKADHLNETREVLGLARHQVLCAGDGANDMPMFHAAGFGVAWRAKPALRAVAACCLDHVGLEGILRLFE